MTDSAEDRQNEKRELQDSVMEALTRLKSQVFREIRYSPQFNGVIGVELIFKAGRPHSTRSFTSNNQRL